MWAVHEIFIKVGDEVFYVGEHLQSGENVKYVLLDIPKLATKSLKEQYSYEITQ
jgi:hypothetical protein